MRRPQSHPYLAPLAVIAIAGVVALGGCTVSPDAESTEVLTAPAAQLPLADLELLADPKSYRGESTAMVADQAIHPVGDAPAQVLPAEVVSHDRDGDESISVKDTSRVLAVDLAGSIAATVWGLGFGDSLVGRDSSTTFPGTEDLRVATSSGHAINAESTLALDPTLVLTDGTIGPHDVFEQFEDAGITVVYVENEPSFAGAEELARQVAAAFGAPAAGELLAERIAQDVADTRAAIAAIAPKDKSGRLRMVFLYIRGGSGVYYLFGEESGADELISALGGVDVAGEIGWTGMRPMTDEALIAANPDLILVMTKGIESAGGVDGLLETKIALTLTNAGANRRFVDMADGDILSFGPRSARVLDALARAIYAPGE